MTEPENAESKQYVRDWAASVAAAVEAAELKLLVQQYRSIARNRNLASEDRSIARRRAYWLARHLQK